MSSSLFKKSLEIVDSKDGKNFKRKNVFDLMPENHKIIKTIKNRGRKRTFNEIKQTKKRTVEDAKKGPTVQDKVEENIRKLLLLSSVDSVDTSTMDKLVNRAQAKHYTIPEPPKAVEQESIFTEEDFANLEKELFFED